MSQAETVCHQESKVCATGVGHRAPIGDATLSTKTSATISPTAVTAAKWVAALVFVTAIAVGAITETQGWSLVATNIMLASAIITAFIAIALVTTRCIQQRINRATRQLTKMETRLLTELQHTRQTHYATLAEAKTVSLKSV